MRSSHRLRFGFVMLASVAALPLDRAAAQEGTPDASDAVQLLFHADLDGQLAVPGCGKARRPAPDFADLVGALAQARAGRPASITLLGGNTIAPGLFARGLIERDGDEGAAALAALFAAAGYDAVALGHHDLALPRARFAAFASALRTRGLPLVATNLRCDDARQPLCAGLRERLVVSRGGRKVGILATLSPRVLVGLPWQERQGLTLVPPEAAVRVAVAALRAEGASPVVLLAEVPRSSNGVDELVELQRRLGTGGPDVILASGLARPDEGSAVRLLRQDDAPPIIGSSAGTASIAALELVRGAGGRFALEVASRPSVGAPRDAESAARLAPLARSHCERYGQPLGAAGTRGPIDRRAFTAYLLAVMRKRAGAEIALLNRAYVKADPFPFSGRLTREDLLRALPYAASLGVARVTGAALAAAVGQAVADPRLATLGLEGSTPKALVVNGRPLDPTRHYRVATIEFVARGGDELLPDGALPLVPLPGAPELRALVERHLETATADEDGDPTIDPATDFGPPASARPLLVATADLALDLAATAVDRAPAAERVGVYAAPQLTRAEQRSVKGDLVGLVQLRAPAHEADARLKLLYGWTRNAPEGRSVASAESADLVSLSTIYNFRGLRDLSAPLPRVALPDPYARVLLESELTRPEASVAGRTYRHAELTATAGALFALTPKLRLRGGPGLRKQLLADGPPGRARFLFEAGAALDPIALASLGPLTTRLEGLVDYVFIDPSDERQHQLKATGRISVPLLPLLFFTAGLDVYAAQQRRLGWAAAYDTTVGLKLRVDGARQRL